MTPAELEIVLRESWDRLRQMSKERVLRYRSELIRTLDGDVFYKIHTWPKYIRRIFFQNHAPIGDKQTFILSLFFVGNGVSFYMAGRWILSSHALFDWSRARHSAVKRIRQLVWISQHMEEKKHKWSYFDIDARRIIYLNGNVFKSWSSGKIVTLIKAIKSIHHKCLKIMSIYNACFWCKCNLSCVS